MLNGIQLKKIISNVFTHPAVKMANETESRQIYAIDSRPTLVRIGLLFAVLAALVFVWFAVRWQLGNMLADLTSPNEPNAGEIARMAVDLAPSDPTVRWLETQTQIDFSDSESLKKSVENYENIVRLSPNDFQWWIQLGRAYEQTEQTEKAEKAFARAVELAPNYTFTHWQLGNFYLRQGNGGKAFSELQKAAENNAVYREQVFSIAWDYFGRDTKKIEQIAGNSPEVLAGLAKFYAAKEQPADSLRVWNKISPEDKPANKEVAKIIAQALYDKRFFRQAIEFVRDLKIEPNAKQETIQNAGFEDAISDLDKIYFDWNIKPLEKMSVKLDPTQKHEGRRSLRVNFSGFSSPELYTIFQTVTVEPNAGYNLSFWLKTDDLQSGGTPVLQIINANDDKLIAESKSFPPATNDWQKINLEFTAPDNSEAIVIRTSRSFCGVNCPIVGTFWYDDFNLTRVK